MYALCNGWITEGTTVIEASSGSTAISEAYFTKLLGLGFIAVMPQKTSPEKIAQIAFYGGRCHFVESASARQAVPIGMLQLAQEMQAQNQTGSIVSLLCDAGDRYLPTYHDAAWVQENFGDCDAARARVASLLEV